MIAEFRDRVALHPAWKKTIAKATWYNCLPQHTSLQGHITFNSEGNREDIELEIWRYIYESNGELEL